MALVIRADLVEADLQIQRIHCNVQQPNCALIRALIFSWPIPVQLTEQALAFASQCVVVLRVSLLTLEIENHCEGPLYAHSCRS